MFRRTRSRLVPLVEPLPQGRRVRVRRDPEFGVGPWPDEPAGTIASWEWVSTVRGRQKTYWVEFDEPQEDADGDGPYAASQVLEQYLEPVAD